MYPTMIKSVRAKSDAEVACARDGKVKWVGIEGNIMKEYSEGDSYFLRPIPGDTTNEL